MLIIALKFYVCVESRTAVSGYSYDWIKVQLLLRRR